MADWFSPSADGHRQAGACPGGRATIHILDVDIIHDMGIGWYCDIFQSHDGSRLAQREQKQLTVPSYLRLLKRASYHVLARYRVFDALSARQFGNPDRLFLALSWMVAHDYQHLHNVAADRIRLVYNGVDTRRFSPEHRTRHRQAIRRQIGVREDEILALFVGHDFRRKGLATAIRAVARLATAGKPIRLAVVGGKRPQGDREYANQYRADGPATFVGFVYDAVPYYAAANVFVLPSFYDPCSLSVLEAAASGLPSITTRVNGAGELLTQGKDGLLLSNPADDQELASQLQTLLDPVIRRRMGEAARRCLFSTRWITTAIRSSTCTMRCSKAANSESRPPSRSGGIACDRPTSLPFLVSSPRPSLGRTSPTSVACMRFPGHEDGVTEAIDGCRPGKPRFGIGH